MRQKCAPDPDAAPDPASATAPARFLAIFMPWFAVERAYGPALIPALIPNRLATGAGGGGQPLPRALYLMERGAARLCAVDREAGLRGVSRGEALADARARVPELVARLADPVADARALDRLGDWCSRYSPWVAARPPDALMLNVTGCAHLFGGEAALGCDILRRLSDLGHSARLAIADTPGAALAMVTHGAAIWCDPAHPVADAVAPPGETARALHGVDLCGLGLDQETVHGLRQMGLRRIGDLYDLPRPALARRFGQGLLDRLDRALGRRNEPITPRRPTPARTVRMSFAEPIGQSKDVTAALDRLLSGLCAGLEQDEHGVRRLELAFYRIDGGVERRQTGTARPSRDPGHLARLFADRIDGIDAGFGIETMVLSALVVEPLAATQHCFSDDLTAARQGDATLDALVDRLINRLGDDAVWSPAIRQSHIPEACVIRAPPTPHLSTAFSAASGPGDRSRPVRLLAVPEPVEAIAPVPDDPPALFRWRDVTHRVVRSEGPERIEPEWWRLCQPDDSAGRRDDQVVRDYYRVEDQDGRRYWLFRRGLYNPHGSDRHAPSSGLPLWFVHGFFA